MVPFCQVELEYVYYDLEGHDDHLENEVVSKVTNLNSVQFSDQTLFIEDPEQKDKVGCVEEIEVIISVTIVLSKQWFNFYFDQIIFYNCLLFVCGIIF